MSTQSFAERPGPAKQNLWPIALVFAGAAFAAQIACWWVRSPAVMAGGSVATLGLLLCLPHLWRRHREDIDRAAGSQEQAEQIRRAAESQLGTERAHMNEQWQSWRQSQLEAFHESVEIWCHDLRTVLTERKKPEISLPRLSPQTAKLLDRALEEVDEELVDVQDACEHAVVFLAQRLQAGGLQIQERTSGLMGRPEPGLPELGMEIDHLATTFAHHAQSLRILGGSWTGQQWQQTVPLTDVVRAAGGQITDYQRVVIGGEPDLGVKDFAAEWLIHLVAELLGNATTYSPSTKEVTAQLEAVPSGAVIQIDDRGTGMTEARLQRAHELVAGERDITLRDLQTPQVGLAVVGNIARRLKLHVSLGRSPYGGIRAVVLVPMDLLEAIDPVDTMPLPEGVVREATPLANEREETRTAVPAPVPHPAPERAVTQQAPAAPSGGGTGELPRRKPAEEGAGSGLPRRRSPRHSRPAAVAEPQQHGAATEDDPEAAASFMSTFVLGGRTDSPDETDSPMGEND
ncbi:ATP-binding protein [Streptomyces ovatisporus]|uniref:histidine kinase n=1 Tax=Streptomyces ovatisporus TaxID=1128682 RepID=A0ABV9A477_9ACTN